MRDSYQQIIGELGDVKRFKTGTIFTVCEREPRDKCCGRVMVFELMAHEADGFIIRSGQVLVRYRNPSNDGHLVVGSDLMLIIPQGG
jgi:hypothetical protein